MGLSKSKRNKLVSLLFFALIFHGDAHALTQKNSVQLVDDAGELLGFAHVFEPDNYVASATDRPAPIIFLPGFDLDIAESVRSAQEVEPGSRLAGLQLARKLRFTQGPSSSLNQLFEELVDVYGHTVLVLEYSDDSAGIETSAQAFELLVSNSDLPVRKYFQQSGVRSIVLGWSMGGLVARYGLTKLESEYREHFTELFISYDVPHRGARLPLSLEVFTNVMQLALSSDSSSPSLFMFESILESANQKYNSASAKEMMNPLIAIAHQDTTSSAITSRFAEIQNQPNTHSAHERFYELRNKLFSLGQYPTRSRNIAISNGNAAFNPLDVPYPRDGNYLARLTARAALSRRFSIRILDVRLFDDPTTAARSNCSIYYFFKTTTCPPVLLPSLTESTVGSYSDVVSRLADAFENQQSLQQEWANEGYEMVFSGEVSAGEGKSVFIPIHSAFDTDSIDVASGIGSLSANTPFDAVYANATQNEKHNAVSPEIYEAILHEIGELRVRRSVLAALPAILF